MTKQIERKHRSADRPPKKYTKPTRVFVGPGGRRVQFDVVISLLVLVGENVVSFRNFLESFFGLEIVFRVAVGMILLGHLEVGLLDHLGVGVADNAENLVKILLSRRSMAR